MKRLFLIVIWFFAANSLFASFQFNSNCQQAYTEILCLRFTSAEKILSIESKTNSANQIPTLLLNYIDFFKVIISEQDQDLATLKIHFEPRLQKLAADDRASPWFLYSQAVLYLQQGFAKIKFEQYISAGLDINRAYRLLEENEKKFPDFILNKSGLGMLHTLIGTVPPKYRWAVRSLNFKGTVLQGTQELSLAMKKIRSTKDYSVLEIEPLFLLSFSYLNLSANLPAAIKLGDYLKQSRYEGLIKQSPLLTYLLVKISSQSGNNEQVIKLISGLSYSENQFRFHYLNYLLGVAKMNRLDNDALYPLLDFVADFKGKNYIKSAYLYISWYYLLHNNHSLYKTYVQRIQLRGNQQVDNDKEASGFFSKSVVPNACLIKSRLLFDGGYYEKALQQINLCQTFTSAEHTEAVYRKGRIYDKWGKSQQAIYWYKETIKEGEKLPYYYAANASLNLALIYEKSGQKELATIYFRKVLSMKFDEYHFSITNKAEAGLNRLGAD